MNGFGQDPNYMYSFRQAGYNPQQSTIDAMSGGQDALRSLRESLAHRQAGMEGKQRMERVVSMGFPANTDINKIQRVGYDPEMRRPIYVAPRPQPWGTFGSIGMDREERPVATKPQPAGGPQPAEKQTSPTQASKTAWNPEFRTTGALSRTPFGERVVREFPSLVDRGAGPLIVNSAKRWFDQNIPRFPYATY